MKSLVTVSSASAVLILGLLCLLPLACFADSNPDRSGKIAQGEAESQKQIFKDTQGNQLEKVAPDLFKDQTEAAIKTKQAEEKKTVEKLFTVPHQPDTEFKDMEKILFSKDYAAQNKAVPYATNDGSVKNPLLLTAFGVLIAAACVGIYIILKKWLGVKERR